MQIIEEFSRMLLVAGIQQSKKRVEEILDRDGGILRPRIITDSQQIRIEEKTRVAGGVYVHEV